MRPNWHLFLYVPSPLDSEARAYQCFKRVMSMRLRFFHKDNEAMTRRLRDLWHLIVVLDSELAAILDVKEETVLLFAYRSVVPSHGEPSTLSVASRADCRAVADPSPP